MYSDVHEQFLWHQWKSHMLKAELVCVVPSSLGSVPLWTKVIDFSIQYGFTVSLVRLLFSRSA